MPNKLTPFLLLLAIIKIFYAIIVVLSKIKVLTYMQDIRFFYLKISIYSWMEDGYLESRLRRINVLIFVIKCVRNVNIPLKSILGPIHLILDIPELL